MPWSRPSSTARVTAPDAEPGPHLVERRVQRAPAVAVERQRELGRIVVREVGDRDPDQRDALTLDQRSRRREQHPGGDQDDLSLGRRVGQRVRPGGAREVAEAQPQDDGAADPAGGPHPPGDAVDERDQRGVDRGGRPRRPAERPLRSDRTSAAAGLHRTGVAVVRQRVQMPAGGDAQQSPREPPRRAPPPRRPSRCRARAAWPPSPGRRPRAVRPAAGAGTRARRRAAPRAGRRAWPHRLPPWPETSSARRRP